MSLKRLYESKPQEQMVFFLRRHPVTFVRHTLFFGLMAGVPAFLAWMIFEGQVPNVTNMLFKIFLVFLGGAYYLGIWVFFLTEFCDFYLDMSIVTDMRIIDVDQRGLFNRSISELDLSRIQDVHSEVKGVVASLFNYGTVVVQTAGEERNFTFNQVRDPHGVRQKVLELAHKDRVAESKELLKETGAI